MRHNTKCRFCQKPIVIEIDDAYSPTEDPYKILPLSSCNSCGDLRVERRKLEEHIGRCCSLISITPVGDTQKRRALRVAIGTISRQYARMIARWYGNERSLWEEAVADQFMDHPDQWPETVGRMWRSFRQWQKQNDQPKLNV